ncbi:MAG: MFS transporter, partial [Ardenticatenaceae bacterium]
MDQANVYDVPREKGLARWDLEELRSPQLWAVAATFGAITMMWTTYNEYVPQFLRGTFGLPALVVLAVLTLDNLLGFFLEPLTGLVSDSTRTRWGRRLPWILVAAPLAVA